LQGARARDTGHFQLLAGCATSWNAASSEQWHA